MIYLTILLNLWLHNYTKDYKIWHHRYDGIYKKYIKKKKLEVHGIDLHWMRAVAIIESGQREKLKGGGQNLFWGVFQISNQLAKKFGNYRHREMLEITKNVDVFTDWMQWTLKYHLLPALKNRDSAYPKLTKKQWSAILYWTHNMGPGLSKFAITKKRPIRWMLGFLKRNYSELYDRKERIYRLMLGLLTYEFMKISEMNTIDSEYITKIPWWSTRSRILKDCLKFKKVKSWRDRSNKLKELQEKLNLSITGIWDSDTEIAIIKKCELNSTAIIY